MFRSRLLKSWLRLCDWPRPCSVPSMNQRWDMFHIKLKRKNLHTVHLETKLSISSFNTWSGNKEAKQLHEVNSRKKREWRVVDVFITINHCRGSVTFWCGSGSRSAFRTSDSWLRIWIRIRLWIRLLFSVTLRMQKTHFIFFAYNLPACTLSLVFFRNLVFC